MKGGGIIQNTAGEGILNVFVCARINMQRREMFPDKEVEDLTPEEKDSTFNADSSKFVVYMSAESHFSGTRNRRTAVYIMSAGLSRSQQVSAGSRKSRFCSLQICAIARYTRYRT